MHLLETGLDILSDNNGEDDAPPDSPEPNEEAVRNGFYLDTSDSEDADEPELMLNPVLLLNLRARQFLQEDSSSSEEGPYQNDLWRYHAEQFQRVLEADYHEIDNESSDMDTSSEHSFELGVGIDDEPNNYVQQRASIMNAQYVNILSPMDVGRESISSSTSSLSSASSQSSNYNAPGDPRDSGEHNDPSLGESHSRNRENPTEPFSASSQSSNYNSPGDPRDSGEHDDPSLGESHSRNRENPTEPFSASSQSSNYNAPGDPRDSGEHDDPSLGESHSRNRENRLGSRENPGPSSGN